MTLSLAFAFGWLVLANVTGMFPSKYHHWPRAYGLIVRYLLRWMRRMAAG